MFNKYLKKMKRDRLLKRFLMNILKKIKMLIENEKKKINHGK